MAMAIAENWMEEEEDMEVREMNREQMRIPVRVLVGSGCGRSLEDERHWAISRVLLYLKNKIKIRVTKG